MNKNFDVKVMPIETLVMWDKNPRKHAEDIDALVKSIKGFGWTNPILVQRGTNRIVAGHGRLMAAKKLGLRDVPVMVMDFSDTEADDYTVADNRLAQNSGWDLTALKDILLNLDVEKFDLKLTGFDDLELRSLVAYRSEAVEEVHDVPALPAKPKTKKGDRYALGEHILVCGDSSVEFDVCRLIGKDYATVMFTDPPYGVAIGAKNRMLNKFQKSGRNLTDIESDQLSPGDLHKLLLKIFKLTREVALSEQCAVFVCSPQGGSLGMMMLQMMKDAGLEARHVLNWVKNGPTFSMGRLDYDYQHEPILFTWTKTHKRTKAGPFQTSVWNVNKPMKSKEHPTMKPVELPHNAIANHSDHGDIVFDPFGGSGSTLIAAEQLERRCRMMEISPAYCDVIVKRWENMTGKKAKLI